MFDLDDSKILGNGCPQLHSHFEFPNVIRSVKDLHAISEEEEENKILKGKFGLILWKKKTLILVFFFFLKKNSTFVDPQDELFCFRK